MNFRTAFQVQPFSEKITYEHNILFLGSCFAENISIYFEHLRFRVQKNPFGIMYHPEAIQKNITQALNTKTNQFEDQIFKHAGLWSHFDAHSVLSSPDKGQHLTNLNLAKQKTKTALKESDYIFISFGTAWIYKHLEKNITVNNCHKIPSKQFEKNLMTLPDTEEALSQIIQSILQVNTDAKFILTLSPVRHLKDGFVENQRSKSTLHLAIQNIVERYRHAYYFPSYELLLDDLRDYRFYDNDNVHPNTLALDYIWFKLKHTVFSEETLKLINKVDAINKRLKHRPLNPDTKASIAFKAKTKKMVKSLEKRHPEIIF